MAKNPLPLFKHRTLKQALDLTSAVFLTISLLALIVVIYQAIKLSNLYEQQKIMSGLTTDLANASVHGNQLLTSLRETRQKSYSELASAVIVPLTALYQDKDALQNDYNALSPNAKTLREDTKESLERINAMIAITRDILNMRRDSHVTEASLNARFNLLEDRQAIMESDLKVALSHASQAEKLIRERVDKNFKSLTRFLVGAIILLVLLALFAYYNVNQQIIVPLDDLTNTVKQVTEGEINISLPIDREDEIGALAKAFQQMLFRVQEARHRLATLVEERTKALQRRTAQIQTATEVGRAVATERDLSTLLPTAARLIAQRYGYYHVGIYLTAPTGDYAELQAAYSQDRETEARLLREKPRLAVGIEGLVGQVIGSGRAQTIQQVTEQEKKTYKHLLPYTAAAAAIPLKVSDEVLGAIDVQCKRPEAFPPEDITALQAVADQLAIAIQNLRLLQETREALEEARRAYAQLSAEGWRTFLTRRRTVGYRLLPSGEIHPKLAKAPSTSPRKRTETAQPAEQPAQNDSLTLEVPLEVRGVAVAKARLVKATPWTQREKRMIKRLSERVGLALESARLYAEAQRRAAQLQIASEIAREANSTLELEVLLERAVNLVRERFNFYHASIFLKDETGRYMEVRASTGEAGKQMLAHHHRLAIGSASIVGQTAANGEPVVVNNVAKSKIHHFNPLLPNTNAEAGIPLKAGDEVIGVLDIQSEVVNAFAKDDIRILQILADQLTIAVLNANLFAETQRNIEHHRIIHKITAAAASATTIEDAINNALRLLAEAMPGNAIAFLRPDEHDLTMLYVVAIAGVSKDDTERVKNFRAKIGEGIVGKAAATGHPIIVPDTTQTPQYIPALSGIRSEVAVPMIYRGRLLGVLDVESPRVNAFSEADKELLLTLANSLAAIWANISLLEQIRKRSNELQLLYEITSIAASQVDLNSLLNSVTVKLQQSMDLLHCGIILFDAQKQTGTLVASASAPNAPGADMIGIKIPITGQRLTEEVITTHKPVVCRDIETDERVANIRHLLRQRGTKQIIVLPLLARNEIIGTIGLEIAEKEREITESDLRLLEQIAHQISTAVEAARLFDRAVRTAEREHLLAEITAKLRATNDPMVIIQTAVEEMQRALKAKTAQLLITDSTAEEK